MTTNRNPKPVPTPRRTPPRPAAQMRETAAEALTVAERDALVEVRAAWTDLTEQESIFVEMLPERLRAALVALAQVEGAPA
jgi:hypothetical protein